jgi:hypothetical protein
MPDVCLTDASATFTDNSTIADNTTGSFTYLWNFGDANATTANPNTSTLKNPSHKYIQAAVYQVTLSCNIGKWLYICYYPKFYGKWLNTRSVICTVAYTSALCSDQQVTFTNTSTVDFGSITKVEWYYDYGNNPGTLETDESPATASYMIILTGFPYPGYAKLPGAHDCLFGRHMRINHG